MIGELSPRMTARALTADTRSGAASAGAGSDPVRGSLTQRSRRSLPDAVYQAPDTLSAGSSRKWVGPTIVEWEAHNERSSLSSPIRTFGRVIVSNIFALGRDDERIARLAGGMLPMVAPNYAATRSALAKSIGLGRKAAARPPAAAEKPKRAARAVAARTTAVSIKSPPKKVRKAPAKPDRLSHRRD